VGSGEVESVSSESDSTGVPGCWYDTDLLNNAADGFRLSLGACAILPSAGAWQSGTLTYEALQSSKAMLVKYD